MVAYQHFGNFAENPESLPGLKGDHLAVKYYVILTRLYKKQIRCASCFRQSEDEAKKNCSYPFWKPGEMLRQWEAMDVK